MSVLDLKTLSEMNTKIIYPTLVENRLVIPDVNKAEGGGEAYNLRTL